MLHLQVEDFPVDIDVAVDLGLAHQVANGGCVSVILAHGHLLSPLVVRNMIYVKKFPLLSLSMIPKSGNRFSDKIMLKTKNLEIEDEPRGFGARYADLHHLVAGALILAEDVVAMVGYAF